MVPRDGVGIHRYVAPRISPQGHRPGGQGVLAYPLGSGDDQPGRGRGSHYARLTRLSDRLRQNTRRGDGNDGRRHRFPVVADGERPYLDERTVDQSLLDLDLELRPVHTRTIPAAQIDDAAPLSI